MIIAEQFDKNKIFIKDDLLHAEVIYDQSNNKHCFKYKAIESISKEMLAITIFTNNGHVTINFTNEEKAETAYEIARAFIESNKLELLQ